MSPIWDGWNPRIIQSEHVPMILSHLRQIQESLVDVQTCFERIHAVLAPMNWTELELVVARCVAVKPPEQVLSTLMTALEQRQTLAGELSVLASALATRRTHLNRVGVWLVTSGSLLDLFTIGRASVSNLFGVVGPATTLSQVAKVCEILGDLDLAISEIRQISAVQPDGFVAQGACTWSDLARVGSLRDGAICDLPRGFLPHLATYLCGPIERIRQVDDLIMHLHELQDLETTAASLPCSADVLPPEQAASLEAAVSVLLTSGFDDWTVGVIGLAGDYLAEVVRQAEVLATCNRTILTAWGENASLDVVLTGIQTHLVLAVQDVKKCDSLVARSILSGRITLTQLGWVTDMRQKLAEYEAVANAACARCEPPCAFEDPILTQVREAWKVLPQEERSFAETVGAWLSMTDSLSRAYDRCIGVQISD